MRDNKVCFVQFTHPGQEHGPDTGLIWNRGLHKRKFLKNPGVYLDNNRLMNNDLLFWSEWEAQSRVHKELDQAMKGKGPRYIYEPYLIQPEDYRGLQNTDPFVFGETFHYTCCRQFKRTRGNNFSPTQVRHLSPGSLILFGSCVGKEFVLDTLFVVDEEYIDFNGTTVEQTVKGRVSPEYYQTTICPLYPDLGNVSERKPTKMNCSLPKDSLDDNEQLLEQTNMEEAQTEQITDLPDLTFRLYNGVSYEQRHKYDGMFSFFPCLPYSEDGRGFPRPFIHLPEPFGDVLTDNLAMGFKASERSRTEMVAIWNEVIKQVREQGLFLGVRSELPKFKP